MTSPEATPEDMAEQRSSLTGDAPLAEAPDIADEVPVADALEQSAEAAPGEHVADRDLPMEADEADAAEQAVVVEIDDDGPRE
jgi:hypothetical protein